MDYLKKNGDFHKYDNVKSELVYGKHPSNPLFSIIIPTYKRPELLKFSIESAINQKKFTNYEIIVVDNDDENKDNDILCVIQSFVSEKIVCYKNEKNIGIYGNTLRAAQLAHGKYVSLLNDDDLLHPRFLEVVNEFIQKFNFKGLIGSQPYSFKKNDFKFPELEDKVYAFKIDEKEFFFGCCVTSPGLTYPKAIIEDIYNQHEELLMGDQIIQYKAMKQYGLMYVNFPISAYRISDNETLKESVLVDMIVNMCKFREQTAKNNIILKIFMKIFKENYFEWYINSSLNFWKRRGIRKEVASQLKINGIYKYTLKNILLQNIIDFVNIKYSEKHSKKYNFIEVK